MPATKDELIAQEVEAIIAQGVDSVVKVELLCFFHRNPSTFDTARGLALRLGRREEEVAAASEELVAGQYLRAFGVSPARSFALGRDPGRLSLCQRIEQLLGDRNTRLSVLAKLHTMRR